MERSLKLYFVRHGTAASKLTWTGDDDLRPLTRVGRRRFQGVASSLIAAGLLRPDLIVTSPLVRARQTAELLSATLPTEVPIQEDVRLGHEFDLAALGALLSEHSDLSSLAIVGHNPSFGAVLSQMVGGANLEIRKGAVALVQVSDPPEPEGCLIWLAPPSIFKQSD